jgi:hypothetical protein
MHREHKQSGSPGSIGPLSPAERLLVEFIARRGDPEGGTFQALCDAHPEHARELERLYTEWCALDRARSGSRASRPAAPVKTK